ncbi:hypothetical protein TWF481_011007 [Arthrobotrys musiformis]|uniref:F-box domain-containing protein n=1 Tax=Arthrobotrys musiformis TaxID=47236 RepID=A0AAV9VX19_9PEZI
MAATTPANKTDVLVTTISPKTPVPPKEDSEEGNPLEIIPFSEREGNVETGMFVNLDTKETMMYPIHLNEKFPDIPDFSKERWAIRKAIAEMMLGRQYSERYRMFKLHEKRTSSIKDNPDATGRLSWLPSHILSRILNRLDILSVLALAVTSRRFLKLTAAHVGDILMPPHVGAWAGNRVQYVHVCLDYSLHKTSRRTKEYIENYVNYHHFTKTHRIVQPPRSAFSNLTSARAQKATKLLTKILAQVQKFPATFGAIGNFIMGVQYDDEFWCSFHKEKKYWFHKPSNIAFDSGEITVFDLHTWVSPHGPGRMDEDSLPSEIARCGMYFLGENSFFPRGYWAGQKWSIVPCEDSQDNGLDLTPLERGERRQQMIEDILLREEGGSLTRKPRKDHETSLLYYRDNPEVELESAVSKAMNERSWAIKKLMLLLVLYWAYESGFLGHLSYFLTLLRWAITGYEHEN